MKIIFKMENIKDFQPYLSKIEHLPENYDQYADLPDISESKHWRSTDKRMFYGLFGIFTWPKDLLIIGTLRDFTSEISTLKRANESLRKRIKRLEAKELFDENDHLSPSCHLVDIYEP